MTHLFNRDADTLLPTDRARGPWDPNSLHGGPVAALLAWDAERQRDTLGDKAHGFRLARLTTDLFKAIPFKPLTLDTRIVRRGGRVMVVETNLLCDGDPVSRGTSLLLRESDAPATPNADIQATPQPPPPEESDSSGLLGDNSKAPPSYASMIEARFASSWTGSDPTVAWINTNMPLFEGEDPSPAVRAAAISDFVSPFANMRGSGAPVAFINADITLYMHREPAGDWHCISASERGHGDGITTASATLRDANGPYGHASAAAIVNTLPGMADRAEKKP